MPSHNVLTALSQSMTGYSGVVPANSLSGASYASKRSSLYDSFGSSKKLKVLKSQAANQVSMSAVVGGSSMLDALDNQSQSKSNADAILAVAAGGDALDPALLALSSQRSVLLPSHDEETRVPQDVYALSGVLGDDAWGMILAAVKNACKKDDWLKALGDSIAGGDSDARITTKDGKPLTASFSPALFSALRDIASAAGGGGGKGLTAEMRARVAALVLCRHCVLLFKGSKRLGKMEREEEVAAMLVVPERIAGAMLRAFAERSDGKEEGGRGGWNVSKIMRDKLLAHVLVTFLVGAGGGNMMVGDVAPLVAELQVESKNASEILRMAGCTVKRGTGDKKDAMGVELRAPVNFPGPKRGRK